MTTNSILRGNGGDDDNDNDNNEMIALSALRGVDCLGKAAAAAAHDSGKQRRRVRVAISWTGGKDCHLALQRTLDTTTTSGAGGLEVVCLVIFSTPGHEFSAHRIEWQRLQAQALQLPLVISLLQLSENHNNNNDDYARAYATAIGQLQKDYDLHFIVTGDVDYVGSSSRSNTNFMQQDVCRGRHRGVCSGVQVLLPLWQQSRRDLLEEMLHLDFDIRFSCVKSPYFDATWIGKRLDHDAIQAMMKSNQRVQEEEEEEAAGVAAAASNEEEVPILLHGASSTSKEKCRPCRPLDLSGENGEYHTMVLNGPMYRRRRHHHHHNDHGGGGGGGGCYFLRLVNAASKELKDRLGQEPGERWWVLDEAKTKFILTQQQQQQDNDDDDKKADVKTTT